MPMPSDDSMPTITRMLLLRHAMTAAPDRFHGLESDVGLGIEGRRQAIEAAEGLARLEVDAVISSGLRRAIETAAPIAEALGLEPIVVPELHERRMGSLSGTPIAEGRATADVFINRWSLGDLDAAHDGAESYREIRDRALPTFEALARRDRGRTVIVVAHGVVIRVFLTAVLGGYTPADYPRIAIRHVAVNDLRFDGQRWSAAALDRDAADLPIVVR